jgi:hypothetical protein
MTSQQPEKPRINSRLRWDQVKLPTGITEAELDALILSMMKPHWNKMAMILGRMQEQCKQHEWPLSDEIVAARIQALADADRIEAAGDLRKWRHSEVRLKD